MAVTYGQVERRVHLLLGNVKGADISTVETNYAAASSSSNRLNPDFAFTPVRDAIVNAVEDLVVAICETPRHPERQIYQGVTSALGNRVNIPSTDSLGNQIIGLWGRVRDGSDGKSCQPRPLDDVQQYNNFSGSIYSGLDPYWYAFNGQQIEHTRTTVIINVFTFTRPTFTAGDQVPLWDYHEEAVVCGAVARIAPREGVYMELYNACLRYWEAHIAQIRSQGNQAALAVLAAPATN